jgi:chromosome segregation ATPase
MFGKQRRITELEAECERAQAELEQLQGEFKSARAALRAKEDEADALLERLHKERRHHADFVAANPQRDRELAREAVNFIRYGPLFQTTDPAVPVFDRGQVEQGMRRILAELGE